jgi:predicted phage terminase large subunit-like protein
MFIAWSMAKNPYAQFIHLSYSEELALDNSARIKELIGLDEFQALWPIQIKKDASAKGLWRTAQGGGLKAGAAGGTVTGFGAGVDGEKFDGAIVIDDPLKPDDAESEPMIKKTNTRLNATVKSRCNVPATPIIMIMQRLHDADPAGFALNGGTGDKWEHLKIPVLKADGKPLWEFRHGVKELAAIRAADKYVWNGQYMQEPIADDGEFFHTDGANWYVSSETPKHLNYYGASDYATKDGEGDYTEHGVFGVCPDGDIYVVDWWSGQTKTDVWIEEQIDLAVKYKVAMWTGETGPIKSAIEPWLKRRMRERKSYFPLRWVSHSTPNYKQAHARSFQGLWEHGRIYLPKDKEWAHELLRQLTRFPLGVLDDKVDVCSIFSRQINKVWEQHPPTEKTDTTVAEDSPLIIENFAPVTKQVMW